MSSALRVAATLALVTGLPTSAGAQLIDFDSLSPATCVWGTTTVVRTQFTASDGVTFSGSNAHVTPDSCAGFFGTFPLSGHTATHVLTFSETASVTIDIASPVMRASIAMTYYNRLGNMVMTARDAGGGMVDMVVVRNDRIGEMKVATVVGTGIRQLEITGGFQELALDSLVLDTVGFDAGVDAGTDGGADAGTDAGPDAGGAGTDAGTDGGPATTDAGVGTDAGSVMMDAGMMADAGSSGSDGGGSADAGGSAEDGGCSCRIGRRRPPPLAWLVLLGVTCWIRRRRRGGAACS